MHADHRVQSTSYAFTRKIRSARLLPSFGTVGDSLSYPAMDLFWSTMQIALLNRNKRRTRIELANAIVEYIGVFYDRRRRSAPEYAALHERALANTPRTFATTRSYRARVETKPWVRSAEHWRLSGTRWPYRPGQQ